MPLNVRRYSTFCFLVLVGFVIFTGGQTVTPTVAAPPRAAPTPAATTPQVPPATSGDIMRERISKAKAFIVVRNYNAAIYELENIRKESGDQSVLAVVNVLLMNSYLEQGDYARAQTMLTQFYTIQKTTKPNGLTSYMAVAGQVVKGARSRVERYRALGLSITDRTLPLEALNDLEKMRETLEMVVTQSKEIGADKVKSSDGMMLLEEASNSRSMLARDDYDARKWKDEVADTREQMASSRSVVMNAVNETPADTSNPNLVAGIPVEPAPAPTREREVKTPADNIVAKNETPVYTPSVQPPVKIDPPIVETPKIIDLKDVSPVSLGSSLVAYATSKTQPVYPPAAKSVRASGIVNVEVTVNEKGDVSEVHKTSGPSLLQAAAQNAIKKWKFKPFVRDGQPVKATGLVSFNFAL